MNSRLLEMIIGDWSDDGHGKTASVLVRVWGEDSTDEEMRLSLNKAVEATGVDFANLLRGYGDDTISSEELNDLVAHGFDTNWPKSDIGETTPSFGVNRDFFDQADDSNYSVAGLLMFYAGFGSGDFNWEIVLPPTLVGSHNSILGSSFGYGIF